MSKLAQAVQVKIPEKCQVKRCKKKGCSVSMAGIRGQRVIIDLDCKDLKLPSNQTKCDYIFFGAKERDADKDWVVPMELKKENLDISEVAKQLQSGSNVADRIIPQDASMNFIPVVASGNFSKHEQRELRNRSNNVRFRGRSVIIQRIRCGDSLTQVLG